MRSAQADPSYFSVAMNYSLNEDFTLIQITFGLLRTNVTNSQTFGGNSSNIDFVHILQLDKPLYETNHCILRLVENRFLSEKIDIC